MGVNIRDLVDIKEIEIDELRGKILAMDAYNNLYQYLTTIRQYDGTPLMDKKGRITSHLNGLFYRLCSLMQKKLKFIFIFDGKPPELKIKELESRKKRKKIAQEKLRIAFEEKDTDAMKKFSARTVKITSEIVDDAKKLLDALGVPYITAPSEGESEATELVKKGKAYACVSQDFDTLLFGCPYVVRNLSLEQKKRVSGKIGKVKVKPQFISLSKSLNKMGIDQEKLIVLGILVGTDYNPGGISGIGPKKGLKAVKECNNFDDYDKLFEKLEWDKYFDFSWKEVFDLIKNMPHHDKFDINFKKIDGEKVVQLLVEEHDFSEDRVRSVLDKTKKALGYGQPSLNKWFG